MFHGKSAIITGASSGLGAALATTLAAQGTRVVLFARNTERLEEVARQCRQTGAQAIAISGDVTQPEDCIKLVEAAKQDGSSVDFLVANAGLSMWAPFTEIEDVEIFRRLVEVDYLGVVNCVHAALPELKRCAGLLVAVSSIQGKMAVPLHTGYVAAKHALQGFCDALRLELHGTGVDVLTVLPHWLRGTELRQNALSADGNSQGNEARSHNKESISLEDASVAIVKAMAQRRRQLVLPWKLRLLLGLNALRPQWAEGIVLRAVGRQNKP